VLLANLIALFGIRIPQVREKRRDFEERISLRIMETMLSSRDLYKSEMQRINEHRKEEGNEPLEVMNYEKMKRTFKSTEWRIEVPNELHLLREMELLDAVIPLVFDRDWILSVAPSGHQFICSDRPVSLVWTSPIPSVNYAPGFGVENSELTFPLSKGLAITGCFEAEERVVEVSPARVNQINGRTVAFSERLLYSEGNDFSFSDTDGRTKDIQHIVEHTVDP